MNFKEKIYHSFPFWMQNFFVSLFGYYHYNRRFGGDFKLFYKEALSRDSFSRSEWDEYQLKELRALLVHAYETSAYYKRLFNEHNLSLEFLATIELEELDKLPILEKSVFRQLGNSEILSNKLEENGVYINTSGSTGTPLRILYSHRMQTKYLAIYERSVRNWAGLNMKNSRSVFGGRRILKNGNSKGPYYRYNWVERQSYFSVYHISNNTVSEYVNSLNKLKPDYLEGYSSSIYFLCRFIQENELSAPKLKAVLGSTDKLTVEMRNLISETFSCPVFDSYNGVDLCNLISECNEHSLHIVPDVGIVEVRNSEGELCKPGEVGELISTGLLNHDQPLIRYRIGDLVKLSENQNCKCGRKMPIVDEIVGRVEDVIIGKDGRKMRRFNRIFINLDSIIEGQVIQYKIGEIELKLVVHGTLSKSDITDLNDRVKSQLGDISVKINVVEKIERGANGKFKSVLSFLEKELIL
jgi:phenylacetate-CoA ligase